MRSLFLLTALVASVSAQSTDHPPNGIYYVTGTAIDSSGGRASFALPGPAEHPGATQLVIGALEISGEPGAQAFVFRYTTRATPATSPMQWEDRRIAGTIDATRDRWRLDVTSSAAWSGQPSFLQKKDDQYFLALPGHIHIRLAPPSEKF